MEEKLKSFIYDGKKLNNIDTFILDNLKSFDLDLLSENPESGILLKYLLDECIFNVDLENYGLQTTEEIKNYFQTFFKDTKYDTINIWNNINKNPSCIPILEKYQELINFSICGNSNSKNIIKKLLKDCGEKINNCFYKKLDVDTINNFTKNLFIKIITNNLSKNPNFTEIIKKYPILYTNKNIYTNKNLTSLIKKNIETDLETDKEIVYSNLSMNENIINIMDDYGKLDWDYLCENIGAIPILEEYIKQEDDRKYQSHLDISDVPYFSKINIERLGYNKGDLTNILKNQNILDFYTDLSYEFIVENKQILEKQIEHISKSVNINFNIERKFIKYNETQQLIKNKLENIKTSLQRNIYIIDIFNNLENTLTKKYFFDTIFKDDLITTITVNPVILKLFIPDSLVKIECIKIFISLLKNKKLKSNEKIKKIFKYIPDVFTEISDYKFTQHIFKLKNIIDDITID